MTSEQGGFGAYSETGSWMGALPEDQALEPDCQGSNPGCPTSELCVLNYVRSLCLSLLVCKMETIITYWT